MADLVLSNITKHFGGVLALDHANLTCLSGEVHGLVGENGAGKSTLVKILTAAVPRDEGEITLQGKPLELNRPEDAIRAGIGLVYQELSLLPDLSVAENIFFLHEPLDPLKRVSASDLRERCYELFDRMGIDVANPDQLVRELSLERRQLVEIAKVLSREPQVVIFDEATSALGREQAEWLLRYCGALAQQGKIVIYISHKLSEIQQVADRITVFRNGSDVGVRERGTISTEELVSLILGRRISRLYPPRETAVGSEQTLVVGNLSVGTRLHNVNFVLRRGEILGIGGLSGQGQDELFRGLYGIESAQAELSLDGKRVSIRSPRDALRQGIGIALVPEDRATQGLLLPKSVSDNISLSILSILSRWGLIQKKLEQHDVTNFIERLGIRTPGVRVPAQQLSGGNQQKVVLAKLLATAPRILLLFDSTRGVDVGTKAEIFQLLRELTAKGSSVLLYSTDSEELINMSDRILVMRQGQIQAELSGATNTEENLVRASLGEPLVETANVTTSMLLGEVVQ